MSRCVISANCWGHQKSPAGLQLVLTQIFSDHLGDNVKAPYLLDDPA